MVPAGNKAKRLLSVNHTTKTIDQFNSIQAIKKGSKSLNPLDPFYGVDPLTNEVNKIFEVIPTSQDDISSFATPSIDDYEEYGNA